MLKVWQGRTIWQAIAARETVLEETEPQKAIKNRLRYFAPQFLGNQVTVSVELDGLIVGLTGCEPSPEPGVLWLCYVSVDADYRDKRLSSLMLEKVFEYMAEKGFTVLDCSGYSRLGLERLRPVLQREASKRGITLVDKPVIDYDD